MATTYEEFKAECEKNGLANVTEVEFKENAPDPATGKGWSLMTALRRIRNSRAGIGKPVVVQTIIGFAIGGREYVPEGGIDKSWKQFLSILVPNSKTMMELDVAGTFHGTHGVKSEFRYEETHSTSADGQTEYTNRNVKEIIIGKESLSLATILAHAKTPDEVTVQDLKTPIIVQGIVGDSGFQSEPTWKDGAKDGELPLLINEMPVFQFTMMAGRENVIRVRFMPRKLSKLMLGFPDFEASCKTGKLEEVAKTIAGAPVVVVGYVSKWNASRGREGRNYVDIQCTGMFELPMDKSVQTVIDAPTTTIIQPQTPPAPQAAWKPIAMADAMAQKESAPAPVAAPAQPAVVQQFTPPTAPAPAPVAPSPTVEKRKATIQERMAIIREAVKKASAILGGPEKLTPQNVMEISKDTLTWQPSAQTVSIVIEKFKKEVAEIVK